MSGTTTNGVTTADMLKSIPPAGVIRERLAANYHEAQILRRMLRLAEHADRSGDGRNCKPAAGVAHVA